MKPCSQQAVFHSCYTFKFIISLYIFNISTMYLHTDIQTDRNINILIYIYYPIVYGRGRRGRKDWHRKHVDTQRVIIYIFSIVNISFSYFYMRKSILDNCFCVTDFKFHQFRCNI